MKPIPCTIEVLEDNCEICWIVAISSSDISQAALRLCALQAGLVTGVRFCDFRQNTNFSIDSRCISLSGQTVFHNTVWLETVSAMFLNTSLYGWTNTAHLDESFSNQNGSISITITILS